MSKQEFLSHEEFSEQSEGEITDREYEDTNTYSETAEKCLHGLAHDIDLPTVKLDASNAEGPGIVDTLAENFDREGIW